MAAVDMNPPPEWPVMPTRSISIKGYLRGQLLDGGLLVGQAVIAQVAVAEGVIPLGAVRIAAAVAHLDHDEAQVGQRDIGAFAA